MTSTLKRAEVLYVSAPYFSRAIGMLGMSNWIGVGRVSLPAPRSNRTCSFPAYGSRLMRAYAQGC